MQYAWGNNKFRIPTEMIRYAIGNDDLTKDLRLFVYLKATIKGGHFRLTQARIQKIKSDLHAKSAKTIKKYLNRLLKKRWLTFNSNRKSYRLNSPKRFYHRYKWNEFKIAIWNFSDFSLGFFKAFMFSALTGSHIRDRLKSAKKRNKCTSGPRLTKWNRRMSPGPYKVEQLSLTYLTSLLNVSKGFVLKLKKAAKSYGLLLTEQNFESTGHKNFEQILIRRYADNGYCYRRSTGGNLEKQRPDSLFSEIIVLKRNRQNCVPN